MFNPATLAQNAEAAKDVDAALAGNGDCILELKLDGIRLLAHVTENGVRTFTRSGKEQTGKLPAIEAELAATLPAGTWIDGEIVAIEMTTDDEGRTHVEHNWGAAQSVMGASIDKAAMRSKAVTYSVFDIMAVGGTSACDLPFATRRGLLERMFELGDYTACALTPQMAATPEALEAILAAGFEGAMVKRLDAPYRSGRGRNWLKIKAQDTVDAVIMGYQPGNGKYAGEMGALLVGQYVDGQLVQIAKCSGMSDEERTNMSQNPDAYIGATVEFKHYGQMPSGGYRHPTYMRMRADKPAAECVA